MLKINYIILNYLIEIIYNDNTLIIEITDIKNNKYYDGIINNDILSPNELLNIYILLSKKNIIITESNNDLIISFPSTSSKLLIFNEENIDNDIIYENIKKYYNIIISNLENKITKIII